MEVKQQDDEDAEDQGEGKASGKMGKGQADIKSEEKPEIKKEKPSGDGCKGEPMDTSSSAATPKMEDRDRKPEVKTEPKDEEERSGASGTHSSPASAQKQEENL
ncbi:hypothetical protein J4Q44_G00385200 [Coregonus suidteri]|uniref:Uncharacterized protein n=1 Tax=Coregonus suidteri TaxID=861788 RepID=A0AAN8QCB5_9TELE